MTPEKFIEIKDHFWIDRLFDLSEILPLSQNKTYSVITPRETGSKTITYEYGSIEQWREVRDEVKRATADIMNDIKYRVDLEYFREPMPSHQREELRNGISRSLIKLRSRWESGDEALSDKRLQGVLGTYHPDTTDLDEMIQCFNCISIRVINTINRLETALNIFDNVSTDHEKSNTERTTAVGKVPPATSTPTGNATPNHPGFETYINEKYRVKLMPYLVSNYTNKKPMYIVPMLYALEMLEVLTCKVSEYNQTNLHTALTTTFGNVGIRTSLNSALPIYDRDVRKGTVKHKVEQIKQQIEAFLKAE